ncbi:F420-dependent glucose-6-phosphate dehydrogenase [Dictyobacter vulcani]|uniref:F420-dependent glucose-6-phosphate dehydrogenase n=1 Tax=Dictyobacter vulcani TaxID=2607529 RepID=A0A5J4KEV9_9CHLR|nr:TIGR03557 family F420-dependent LLM class oxidoreductase [Dictyobacter vulcani]GER87858.1 F420-dependent glucose-6-phosphate dehydrogenase [Dictyobacter vulcani]
MVQLGWKAGPEQYPPVELMEYAVSADKAGYDWIDVSDHFHPWSEAGQSPFTWTWLGAVAPQTERIKLSTGVTCPILRYHPSIIAQAAATVSHFAPNRTGLGLGTGEALNEFAAIGEWPSYAERRDRLAESIEIIRGLWTGEELSYEGKYYKTRKAKLYTPPTSPIPIIISSLVPHSAQFAGHYGDGIWSVGGKKPDLYKEIIGNFEESARKAGKDPSKMVRIIELNVAYGQDIDAAVQANLKYWAGTYIPALFDQNIYTPTMSQENGEVVGADTVKSTGCFSTSIDDHVQFAQQYIDMGFDCLIFHNAGPDQKAFINAYARDVLPRIRAKNAR